MRQTATRQLWAAAAVLTVSTGAIAYSMFTGDAWGMLGELPYPLGVLQLIAGALMNRTATKLGLRKKAKNNLRRSPLP